MDTVTVTFRRYPDMEALYYVDAPNHPEIRGEWRDFRNVRAVADKIRVRLKWESEYCYKPLAFDGAYYTPKGWEP